MYCKQNGIDFRGDGPSFKAIIEGLKDHCKESRVKNKNILNKDELEEIHRGVDITWNFFLSKDVPH